MTPRPMFECGGSWAAQVTRAARVARLAWLARACVLGLLIAGPAVVAQTNGPAGPAAYRCGSSYSSTPCPGGSAVHTDDGRSAAQQREAQDVQRRDAAMADQMTADRRSRERDTAGRPAVGIGPPAAASAPRRDTITTTSTQKKKKTVAKKPLTTQPQKLGSAR